jgi:tetratricopeptide (TPR) repeat protein
MALPHPECDTIYSDTCIGIVRISHRDAAALTTLGKALTERGEYRRAVVALRAALTCSAENADCLHHLASALLSSGNPEEATAYFERALKLEPGRLESWQILGTTYLDHLNRPQDAFRSFRHAIELRPDDSQTYQSAARCCLNGCTPEATITRLRDLLPPGTDALQIRRGVGRALIETGRYEEALEVFHGMVRESPNDAASLRSLGQLYLGLRDVRSAGQYFERAVGAAGNDSDVLVGYLLYCAKLGELERARCFYRSRQNDFPDLSDAQTPAWQGQDLHGKTLRLIVGDIYYGDAFQFVRFARAAKQLGARVIVEGPRRIRTLLRTVPGIDLVVAPRDPLPHCDYQTVAFWLLFALGIPFGEIADPVPYIRSSKALRDQWRGKFHETPGFKIGIVWRGSTYQQWNRYACRSMPLRELRPLAAIPGVTLYSLQVGPGREELTGFDPPFPAVDLAPDFPNTAAAIDELDLVVTVDTSIAHLAGALGKPTYVMLPYDACFRWMLDRDETPWYPSVRLFRQSTPGQWTDVVAAVGSAVSGLLT